MTTLKLKNKYQTNTTLVSNEFIDHYMSKANGEFVKVYLFLLRHLDDPRAALTIASIADCLDHTERDVLRAFRYWESEGLLSLEKDAEGSITGLALEQVCSDSSCTLSDRHDASIRNISEVGDFASSIGHVSQPSDPTTVIPQSEAVSEPQTFATQTDSTPAIQTFAAQTEATPAPQTIPLNSFKAQKEVKSLLFIAEQYLGKTLTKTEVDAITYFYDGLDMPAELIEYLIESCVENGHRSIHYIQKVALSWHDEGIRTIDAAKNRSRSYNKNCYTVLNAFGIKNRGPADTELDFIRKWTEEFGFSLELIQEACSRTISATHQPSFEYADTILQKWQQADVHTLSDVTALDIAFQKEKLSKKIVSSRPKTTAKNLNNFERRSYDMDSLEKRLLNSN